MKKFILIEDRVQRQKNFLGLGFNFDNYYNFKNIVGGNEFIEIKNKISQNIFESIIGFEIIAIHRSALNSNERDNLINFCKQNGKDLVFFSGGISNVLFQRINNNSFLTINSKDFYSNNLNDFLNDHERNLNILAFGNNWQINLMIRLAERLINYIIDDNFEKMEFQELIDLTEWDKQTFFKDYTENKILDKLVIKNKIHEIKKKIKECL